MEQHNVGSRPLDRGDWNLAYLFPDEVAEARERIGLIILPLAPIEWHGPHLSMGCDPLLAHAFARRLAQELRCPYFPPLFVGTERERTPEMLESLGFRKNQYIEGMDFPQNQVASPYLREETFALVVRDTLQALFERMRFLRILIVNGHGAENQANVLTRLCNEFNSRGKSGKRVVWVYPGFPRSLLAGSIGHATAEETSLLAATWPYCVDLDRLPKTGKLKNIEYAIIDGETFDGAPTYDFTLREQQDPRTHTDDRWASGLIEVAVQEVLGQVKQELL